MATMSPYCHRMRIVNLLQMWAIYSWRISTSICLIRLSDDRFSSVLRAHNLPASMNIMLFALKHAKVSIITTIIWYLLIWLINSTVITNASQILIYLYILILLWILHNDSIPIYNCAAMCMKVNEHFQWKMHADHHQCLSWELLYSLQFEY